MFQANQIGKLLGISKVRDSLRYFGEDKISLGAVMTNGGRQNVQLLSVDGLKQLVSISRKPKAIEVANLIGIKVFDIKTASFEQRSLSQIMQVFDGEDMRLQFTVESFHVDLYFPKYKLAIECDENHHKNSVNEDSARQSFIEKQVGCRFIRYRPHKLDFCIFKVIGEIHRHILEYKASKEDKEDKMEVSTFESEKTPKNIALKKCFDLAYDCEDMDDSHRPFRFKHMDREFDDNLEKMFVKNFDFFLWSFRRYPEQYGKISVDMKRAFFDMEKYVPKKSKRLYFEIYHQIVTSEKCQGDIDEAVQEASKLIVELLPQLIDVLRRGQCIEVMRGVEPYGSADVDKIVSNPIFNTKNLTSVTHALDTRKLLNKLALDLSKIRIEEDYFSHMCDLYLMPIRQQLEIVEELTSGLYFDYFRETLENKSTVATGSEDQDAKKTI